MATKRTITARLYVLDFNDTRHQITATSSSDLAQQVQQITGGRQAATLARNAYSWGDMDADLRVGNVRIVCVGAIVREVYRTLPPLKGQESAEEKAAQAQQPSQQAPKETQSAATSAEQPQAPKTAPAAPSSQQATTSPTANPQAATTGPSTQQATTTPFANYQKAQPPLTSQPSQAPSQAPGQPTDKPTEAPATSSAAEPPKPPTSN